MQKCQALPRYKFNRVRKVDNSSYRPNRHPLLQDINSPVLSNVASSTSHVGLSVPAHLWHTSHVRLYKYLYNEDLPLPVGMFIEIQTSAGSDQLISEMLTTAGDIT